MRRIFMLALLAVPVAAFAQVPPEAAHWQVCKDDSDCVLIQGICGPVGVNADYKDDAVAYYTQRKASAECKNEFWRPKSNAVRCRIEACEAVVE